jgi:16S rRNA C967 or C1407 C5-methylase (RsmB/RsmF family)
MDARDAKDLGLEFERILLDAPCTGTGTVFKNPEAAEKTAEDVEATAALQSELIEASYNVLKPGGVMVYSTCSFLAEENEIMVDKALKRFDLDVMDIEQGEGALESPYGLKLTRKIRRARRFFPTQNGTQGFFIAKLRKVI